MGRRSPRPLLGVTIRMGASTFTVEDATSVIDLAGADRLRISRVARIVAGAYWHRRERVSNAG
jgi:hypothetical protein